MSFRSYVADSLRLRGEGRYIPRPWAEIIGLDGGPEPVDERPVEEIARDIWRRAGLEEE